MKFNIHVLYSKYSQHRTNPIKKVRIRPDPIRKTLEKRKSHLRTNK
jgi:hypothetical protein